MKSIVALCVLLLYCLVALTLSSPIAEGDVEDLKGLQLVTADDAEESLTAVEGSSSVAYRRQKRVSCDILSFLQAGATFCGIRCVFQGYWGGYCDERASCVCR